MKLGVRHPSSWKQPRFLLEERDSRKSMIVVTFKVSYDNKFSMFNRENVRLFRSRFTLDKSKVVLCNNGSDSVPMID